MDPTKDPVDPNRNPEQESSGQGQGQIQPAIAEIHNGESFLDELVQEYATPPLPPPHLVPRESSPEESRKFVGLLTPTDEELGPEAAKARHYFDERDFQSHRREGFALTHQPLRPIHSHSSRSSRSGSKKSNKMGNAGTGTGTEGYTGSGMDGSHSLSEGQIIGVSGTAGGIHAIEEEEIPESWPLLQDPDELMDATMMTGSQDRKGGGGSGYGAYEDLKESPTKKVQFEVGGSPYASASEDTERQDLALVEKKKFKIRSSKYEDPSWRLRQGSEVPLLMLQGSGTSEKPGMGLPADMPEHDKNELTSHRFEDNKGFRRHKFYPKDGSGSGAGAGGGGGSGSGSGSGSKNKYDHSPHEIFVELDMLSGQGEDREWQETARWIKYEEDLEEGADRWGKPHVASLSFHSLINLRRLLESGVVLMDLEERDLPGVAYRVVDQMGVNDLIQVEEKATVLRSLLLKHRHVHEGGSRGGWGFGIGLGGRRSNTITGSLTSLHNHEGSRAPLISAHALSMETTQTQTHAQRRNSGQTAKMLRNDSMLGQAATGPRGHLPLGAGGGHLANGSGGDTQIPLREFRSSPAHMALDMTKLSGAGISEEDIRWLNNKEDILRRIPTGAEASIVLVGKDDSLHGPTLAFTRLAESVYMPNITEVPIPVRFVFILMGPSSSDLDYKEIGRSISTLMSNPQFHSIAYKAETRKDLLKGIHEFLDESIVLPPGDWDDQLFPFDELRQKSKEIRMRKERRSTLKKQLSGIVTESDLPDATRKLSRDGLPPPHDPFRKTRKLFGGLLNDMKRRYSIYWSDLRDGFNVQCLATIIFLYFACVSGAIAFGGLMGKKTDNYVGITETLIGTSVGGILFALFSAQPLLIIGTTGPLLVFDESLYQFCQSMGMDGKEFLAVRTWIGVWMAVIGLCVALFEGAVIVRYFTRFTIEIFATYISLVFIAESIKSLIQIYIDHPLLDTYGSCTDSDGVVKQDIHRPNVALLGTILMFGTFGIAWFFRGFRNSGYLTKSIRNLLGNFAVLIGIVTMSVLDLCIKSTSTDKLSLPDAVKEGLKNSAGDRDWLIDPISMKLHWIAVSILPALLLYILVFMETSIGELLIGKKEMKLRKGSGFHLDVVLICLINAVMGVLGTCWMSSAIIRGVTHTLALTVHSTNNPPGEKPTIVGVKEQRVTGLIVSILLGLSVLMADVLKLIPLSVLFGVFLFMGISSMSGIQFLERVSLLFKQVQNHPQVPFVRRVRMRKMHVFTLIQMISLGFLWGVKESPAALALPIIIILLVPFRLFVLNRWFTPLELAALDAQGLEVEEPVEKDVALTTVVALNPSPQKITSNGTATANGTSFRPVDANDKNSSLNGTVNDFRSI